MLTLLNLGPYNHVLQDLVQGMANMKTAIGIGWTIMEDEGLIGSTVLPLPLVELVGTSLYVVTQARRKRTRARQTERQSALLFYD